MNTSKWSLTTRLLHFGLVATVSIQLFVSLVMTPPDHKGGELGRLAFEIHEIVGITAVLIVLAHWIATLFFHLDGGISHLFPWRGEARAQVVADLRTLRKGRLPKADNRGGLAGLVHGLGLLAVTGIALTGAALFFLFPETGKPGALAEGFAELHEGIAGLVWTYWIAHGGIAILHSILGHDTTKNMFRLGKEKRTEDASDMHPYV